MKKGEKAYLHESLTARRPPAEAGGGQSEFSIFSATQIGESNKRRVLQMLFDLGPTSRAELARKTGSKRTTITGIVQPMIDSGLLIETETSEPRGVGKPAKPLWFSAQATPVCAVALMPDRLDIALITLTGDDFGHQAIQMPTERRTREDYLERLIAGVEAALAQAPTGARGIGVAVGGLIDPDTGSVVAMNLAPALAGLELRAILQERFGLLTIVDHHPRAILLGERWFGEGRGLREFAVIYADEVLGCAMYLDGKPFRGPHGAGGELGHTVVDLNGARCTCGKRGCWETVATLSWLRQRAATLGLAEAERVDIETLTRQAKASGLAAALLREYAHNLAVGIANLQTLMMPDNYIIYGDAVRGGPAFQTMLVEELEQLAAPMAGRGLTVRMGRDERQTTLRGAAGLVISRQLEIDY
jgi:predicted NBD/HSP70 family sugar kinase